ncbi:ribosome modulation factor [Roseobacteraceae bacterium NS-SX3]
MFENDYPLLSTPSLMALILHRAGGGPVTLGSCEAALEALFRQANETPALPPEALRRRLSRHLSDLETARILEPQVDGAWHLTERGRDALRRHPGGLDHSVLVKYPEFAAHLRATAHHSCGMDPRSSSYDQGYQARLAGEPFTANPYAFDSADHLAWENGWMEALEG